MFFVTEKPGKEKGGSELRIQRTFFLRTEKLLWSNYVIATICLQSSETVLGLKLTRQSNSNDDE